MAFDLGRLDNIPPRWVRVGLEDMEVQIAHVGPAEQEKYRQGLVSKGILRSNDKGGGINSGREDDFFEAYAMKYIKGWRNLSIGGVENPPYDPYQMGRVLATSDQAFAAVTRAVGDEADFFSVNGSGSQAS
jgi:hypothetical protein